MLAMLCDPASARCRLQANECRNRLVENGRAIAAGVYLEPHVGIPMLAGEDGHKKQAHHGALEVSSNTPSVGWHRIVDDQLTARQVDRDKVAVERG